VGWHGEHGLQEVIMKFFDTNLSETKPIEAWISFGGGELMILIPYSFPRTDAWVEDFGRFIIHGIRQRVLCIRIVISVRMAMANWLFRAHGDWLVKERHQREHVRPQPFLPVISVAQATRLGALEDKRLVWVANTWKSPECMPNLDEQAEPPFRSWSNPKCCEKLLLDLGCCLRKASKRSGDGSIFYEVIRPDDRSFIWRTDEFRADAFIPAIRWAIATLLHNNTHADENYGKKFISANCHLCGELDEWVYSVPSCGFISFVCRKCGGVSSFRTQDDSRD